MSNNISVSATDFKAHCLEYIEKVHTSHGEYIITKHNKPVAKLIPISEESFVFGKMKGSVQINGDIMEPIDIDWEAGS